MQNGIPNGDNVRMRQFASRNMITDGVVNAFVIIASSDAVFCKHMYKRLNATYMLDANLLWS